MAQKIVQYQAVLQLAQGSPQMYNMPLLHRQMLEVLGIKDAQKLVPMAEDQKPQDPVSENQAILMQKPVKAFAYQNHEAHILVHMNAMKDPKIMQVLGQSPQAPALQAAMQAHINEHLGFGYRVEIEKQLGMNLPPQTDEAGEDIHMDPEVEARLAPLLAQAAQQLLQMNQGQAQQQQAAKQAQDPLIQMQQQELQIKAQEQQRKAAKDQTDAQLKASQQQIERERIMSQQQVAEKQTQLNAAKNVAELENDKKRTTIEGLKYIAELYARDNHHQQDMGKDLVKTVLNRKERE
jgi:hypothetical protein